MQSSNIEQFNLVVLQLLSDLYEAFPRPMDIDGTKAIDIGFAAVPKNSTNEEAWCIQTLTEDVVVWLGKKVFYDTMPIQIIAIMSI